MMYGSWLLSSQDGIDHIHVIMFGPWIPWMPSSQNGEDYPRDDVCGINASLSVANPRCCDAI